MTIYELFNKWNGRYNDYDKHFGPQCKDLFSQYNNDIVKAPYIVGNPIVLWNNYNNLPTLKKYYTKIPNTLTFIPKLGDVGIFNFGSTGHIVIHSQSANMFWFTSFEQNYPTGSPCHFQSHNYLRYMGVLRPKC
jgi:hypothetical protein